MSNNDDSVTPSNVSVTRDNGVSNATIPYRTVTVPNRTVNSCSSCIEKNGTGNDGDDTQNEIFDEMKLEAYGSTYHNVMLSQRQVDDLLEKMSIDEFNFYLDKLDCFIHDKNAKVKNHYVTMLNWCLKDRQCKS